MCGWTGACVFLGVKGSHGIDLGGELCRRDEKRVRAFVCCHRDLLAAVSEVRYQAQPQGLRRLSAGAGVLVCTQ